MGISNSTIEIMAKENGFLNFVLEDVLGHIPNVTSRAMFGGYGLYKDGVIFGIIAYDQLYFKVEESNVGDYKKLGSEPFVYSQGGHKSTTMSYWLVPEEIIENADAITTWVDKAVEVSMAKKGLKK